MFRVEPRFSVRNNDFEEFFSPSPKEYVIRMEISPHAKSCLFFVALETLPIAFCRKTCFLKADIFMNTVSLHWRHFTAVFFVSLGALSVLEDEKNIF